jgi:hypothetical protein
MNEGWLGLIIPLCFLLWLLTYCVFFPSVYFSEENQNDGSSFKEFLASGRELKVEASGFYCLMITFVTPFILFGFVFGYFQSKTKNSGKKWVGHTIAFLYLLLLFSFYKYYNLSLLSR